MSSILLFWEGELEWREECESAGVKRVRDCTERQVMMGTRAKVGEVPRWKWG